MRVLFLTGHLPFPPYSGGRKREYELLRRLPERGVAVDLVCVSKTLGEDVRHVGRLREVCRSVTVLPADPLPAGPPPPGGQPRRSWHVLRHASAAVAPVVAALACAVDLVHCEGFYTVQHAPAGVPLVLVEQNVEYQLCRQRGDARCAALTRSAERRAWRRASVVGVLTEEDRAVVAGVARRVRLVPDGVDAVGPRPPSAPGTDSADGGAADVLFVGNFGYQPNLDGLRWLVGEIWPAVLARCPGARLHVVGNDPDGVAGRVAAGPAVRVHGRVPDLAPYYRSARVVVVPLRIGGGVKMKTLEALAHGRAIVSTSVGVQGLGAGGRPAIRVADAPREFAAQVAALLADPGARRALRRDAAAFLATLPTWDDAADALAAAYAAAGP